MGNWALGDVEVFTDNILRHYFCESDVEFMISTFSEDIVWLGAGEKQRAEGREAVAACFRAADEEKLSFGMEDAEYISRDLGGGLYLCEGISSLYTKKDGKKLFQTQQRVTFIFRENKDGLETVHIHNSLPFLGLKDSELFPVKTAGRQYARLASTLQQRNIEYERQAQFLEQLYNTVPCGIVQLKPEKDDYEIVNVNRMGWQMYGYTSEEEYRREVKGLLQLVQKKDRPYIRRVIRSLSDDGRVISYIRDGVKKNGEKIWLSVFMAKIVNIDGLKVVQAVFTDITEIKQMEEEQERERLIENRSLRAAICTAYPLILSVNLTKDTYNFFIEEQEMDMIERSGSYSKLMEHTVPEVYSSYREDFAALLERNEIIRRFMNGEHEIYMEFKQKYKDGSYHLFSVHMIYVENPFNNDILAIGLVKNLDKQVTEKAKQEQLLRDALALAKAANRAKSDFLSRMSHDIRTPMNAIIGMTAIGQMKGEDTEGMKACFKKIDISSRYLLSLINDILDMSRIETGKMDIVHEPFDLAELVEEINLIIYPQALEKNIGYEVYHKEPLEIYYIGDAVRLKQILMNLLSNALKFTPAGGQIHIYLGEYRRTNGYSYLQLTVKDSGIGMSEEFKERIFQPFEQESQEEARNNVGSGLGLSIVYNLVHLMGGTVEVESRKDEGTSFDIIVPLQLAGDDGKRERERKKKEPVRDLSVLVVDDDPVAGSQTAAILKEIGADTVWTDSGSGAVEEVKRAARENRLFDAVLIDWNIARYGRCGNRKAYQEISRNRSYAYFDFRL